MSSVLIRRVRRLRGEQGLTELLERAGSKRTIAYLDDLSNWISFDEAMSLLAAAAEVTGDPQIARRLGEETIAQHSGTPVATLLRSLGSPEAIYGQITQTASKFSTVAVLDAVEVSPGRALIRGRACPGFVRTIAHCDWTKGLLSQPTLLFGLPPAVVTESQCQARGAEACVYEITWDAELAAERADPVQHITALESQLSAMTERLDSLYATATDLIADTELDSVLARITERAATAVRAPRYLLALRADDESAPRFHQSGFRKAEAEEIVERLLESDISELPSSWLVADVKSHRRDYGRIVAMSDTSFFPQERYLLELYARYAATALDGATALDEAKRGHEEAQALLELARALAAATTSDEVARRLVDAVPAVVDCDRVSVWVWDGEAGELRCRAVSGSPASAALAELQITPAQDPFLADLLADPNPQPAYFDRSSENEFLRGLLHRFGALALIVAPIVARDQFLGTLAVSVDSEADRLRIRRDLADRLSGVVAQAATAFQTARLVAEVTHQATHDGLTGLTNRAAFAERIEGLLADADANGAPVGFLFVDLDGFKAINDEFGHHAGDDLLQHVGERLMGTIRSGDTVARLGGDEFGIVLTGVTGAEEVKAAAARVVQAFEDPFEVGGQRLTLGASIGHAIWPDHAEDFEALMRHADAEMYRAKRAARTRGARAAIAR
jgi:diguanylate cyclase (GGDEF)-like protein